ncbi:hypothetical protein HAX54_001593 [Datura stramonium]|uniref:Uncharacterized protein n=1 Tax=Datura stramonium TaxID=4076 RepID=A0ABS8YA20_DATST|nr:hypothetical protein [Datura stramonium]
MASQKVFIDLFDNEAEHQDFGSRQDKVTPFEAIMESMGRKIDRIRGLIVDLRNSFDVPLGFSESMSNSHSALVCIHYPFKEHSMVWKEWARERKEEISPQAHDRNYSAKRDG